MLMAKNVVIAQYSTDVHRVSCILTNGFIVLVSIVFGGIDLHIRNFISESKILSILLHKRNKKLYFIYFTTE